MNDDKQKIANNISFRPGIHTTAPLLIGWNANKRAIKNDVTLFVLIITRN